MADEQADQDALLDVFKAVADPARLRVAGAIAGGALSVAELCRMLELPPASVTKHLTRLVESNLAVSEGTGTDARYRWNERAVRALAARVLDSPRSLALRGATDERSRVLAAFLRDGRLTRMPTTESRRMVVLAFIAERFSTGRTYTEREVNAVLKTFADDYSTVRRALVDRAILNRDSGIYWVGEGHREGSLEFEV